MTDVHVSLSTPDIAHIAFFKTSKRKVHLKFTDEVFHDSLDDPGRWRERDEDVQMQRWVDEILADPNLQTESGPSGAPQEISLSHRIG